MIAPLALLLAGMLEIGLVSHARDVLLTVASDAARVVAISGDATAGIAMVEARKYQAIGRAPIEEVRIWRQASAGLDEVAVEIRAPMPLFSIFAVRGIRVLGHAIAER